MAELLLPLDEQLRVSPPICFIKMSTLHCDADKGGGIVALWSWAPPTSCAMTHPSRQVTVSWVVSAAAQAAAAAPACTHFLTETCSSLRVKKFQTLFADIDAMRALGCRIASVFTGRCRADVFTRFDIIGDGMRYQISYIGGFFLLKFID